ncbi:MAG: trans-sulfuration enzyme family protein [Flavobacteriales bacterium]
MKSNKFETQAVRSQISRTDYHEHSVPLYLTSSFVFNDPETMRAAFAEENEELIYSRFDNPNFTDLINKACLLEGTEAGFATSTGMGAVFSTFAALCRQGDHILSCRAIFGSTHTLFTKVFPKWGIETTYVEGNKPESWSQHIQPNTKFFYFETPTNPGLDIIDMEVVVSFCKVNNLICIVDNCFATPYIQQPAKYGCDIVIHSATKFIDGQGRVLGGLILGNKETIKEIKAFCRHSGPAISPFNAWILSKSMETLAVRMDRHCSNALAIAEALEGHSKLEWVKYPFLASHPQYEVAKKQMKQGGGMVAFCLKGGVEKGRRFLELTKDFSLTANLGDSRTIVTHPASTTHSKLTEEERAAAGIEAGMIRLSVGLEHVDDIKSVIFTALGNS